MGQGNTIEGLHLIVDGIVRDPVVFSEHNLRNMFERMAKALEMTIIEGPRFKQIPTDPAKLEGEHFQDEGGISGYCMISTSHISIHCWPLRRIFMADMFSCKDFDDDKAMEILYENLGPSKTLVTKVRRNPYGLLRDEGA